MISDQICLVRWKYFWNFCTQPHRLDKIGVEFNEKTGICFGFSIRTVTM